MRSMTKSIGANGLKMTLALALAALALSFGLAGCSGGSANSDSSSGGAGDSSAEQNADADQNAATVVYEAIFLDNDEISNLFTEVRGETAPFDKVTKDFHVTTAFMPETAHSQWYGAKVTVHITAYAVQDVKADDGSTTSNEGFKAEVTSDNKELNEYLESLGKNYHITGAYKDGAKYTEYVDFSQGDPMDVTVTGTFGGSMSDGVIDLGGK